MHRASSPRTRRSALLWRAGPSGALLACALSLGLAGAAALAGGCSGASAPRPNVLLITLDTTRADAFGCYGRAGDPTPHFDALAAEGTRFDHAVATAAVTPVSHASILSGLWNHGHGLRVMLAEGGFRLPEHVPTLFTELAREGWRTGAVHSAFPVSGFFGLDRGFEHFDSFEAEFRQGERAYGWDLGRHQRRADEATDRALAFVEGTAGEPFALWLHYWDPHDSVLVPPWDFLPQDLPRLADGRPATTVELYHEELRWVDRAFGRLRAALEAAGRWDDTLVVVVADHGEGLGDHGWWHHRILYQEQIRVPLLVRLPPALRPSDAAAEVDALVSTVDVLPTVLEALELPEPGPLDGESLLPLVAGRDAPPRLALADQINGYDFNAGMLEKRPHDDFVYCAMDRRWKLLYRPAHPEHSELFDLEADPREQRNLFEEHPAEVERLLLVLAEERPWVTAPFPPEGEDAASLEAAGSTLAALGYTGGSTDAVDDWQWTCPRHRALDLGEPRACPECGAPPIPVRR